MDIHSDEFQTFIPLKDTPERTIDIQKMMIAITKQNNFSVKEFWDMPLTLVLELLGMFVPPSKKPMSRKTLVNRERRYSVKHGH